MTESVSACVVYDEIIGKTLAHITPALPGEKEIFWTFDDGVQWDMYHDFDCGASVSIAEVIGDINDLIGAPLVEAESVSRHDDGGDEGSRTWTFYKFRTAKGAVTIRWLGQSNGWYSEEVTFKKST